MDSELTSYEAALRDLLAEREEIDVLIDGMRRRIDRMSGTHRTQTSGNGKSIPDDAFFGLTIADAAKKYLSIVKQTKTTPEIGDALVAGGLKHSSADFSKTIRSILGPNNEFLRVNDKWGLSEWYPGAKRSKIGKAEAEKQPHKQKPAAKPLKNNAEMVLELLGRNPDRTFQAEAIAEAISADNLKSLRSLLSQMVKSGRVSKGTPTGYRANVGPVPE